MGALIVTGGDSKEVDASEYCSFPTYFNLWKHHFLDLKVVSQWRTSVRIAMHLQIATGISQITHWDATMMMATTTATKEAMANVAMTDSNKDDGSNNISDVGVRPMRNVGLNHPEAASTKAAKERELMLQAAAHINQWHT
jgi:hypothetical protein